MRTNQVKQTIKKEKKELKTKKNPVYIKKRKAKDGRWVLCVVDVEAIEEPPRYARKASKEIFLLFSEAGGVLSFGGCLTRLN